jgi:hypothetical protein
MNMLFGFTFLGDTVVALVSLAAGVYFHDPLLKFYKGADAFAKSLEAKAASVKAAVGK